MDKTANCGFELLPHPLYSPDLSTSDYHLFPNMKKQLGDRVFTDNEEMMACVLNVLNGFETHSFKEGLKALVKRCEKCVRLNGVLRGRINIFGLGCQARISAPSWSDRELFEHPSYRSNYLDARSFKR